jgi:hypothetical protein
MCVWLVCKCRGIHSGSEIETGDFCIYSVQYYLIIKIFRMAGYCVSYYPLANFLQGKVTSADKILNLLSAVQELAG